MFVTAADRRRGVARQLLEALEQQARHMNYGTLRLETGDRQPEAVALYESSGYSRIPAFGIHVDDPTSICFEKRLAGTPAQSRAPSRLTR
jgi:ribosomal protein S18 acetylase RimI-like enzyme